MPEGFDQTDEAELHKAARILTEDAHRAEFRRWWFAIFSGGLQRSPNFDMTSTCAVNHGGGGKAGILLVEAKAHDEELRVEECGKKLKTRFSDGEKANHDRIGTAIREASESFSAATGLTWSLSHDSHYQMSNRFALAWKLTQMGYPVILVYLGFLNASEMSDRGNVLTSEPHWETLVRSHSDGIFPDSVWNQRWTVNGQSFIPLIKSIEQPLLLEGEV